jgi:thioesterase domain-containing protein
MYSDDHATLIRKGVGDQPPIFFIHDDAGSLNYALALASHMDPKLALYGLPVSSLPPPPPCTLQEMGTRIIVMIKRVRPDGPYRLVGGAMADLLAYEVATQLLGEDDEVDFVGLLDPAHDFLLAGMQTDIRRIMRESIGDYQPQSIQAPVCLLPAANGLSDWRSARERLVAAEWLTVRTIPAPQNVESGARSISLMARLLSDAIPDVGSWRPKQAQPTYSPLIPLQNGHSTGTAIFCVPGAGATVVSFGDLVGRLPQEWRIYGLQARGMDGESLPHTSVAAAALSYLRVIQEMSRSQPIHLVGHSYGGWVAYEIACLLTASGLEVGSLTMIDSSVPAQTQATCRAKRHSEVLQQWIELFEMVLEKPLGVCVAELAGLPLERQLARVHERLKHWLLMPRSSRPGVLRGPFLTFAAALRSNFIPRSQLRGAVHLVTVNDHRVNDQTNQKNNALLVDGWRLWLPELEIFHAPGNHMTILKEPQTNPLGAWLSGKICSQRLVRPVAQPSQQAGAPTP